MGVDYSANFGFGVKVKINIPKSWLVDNEYDEDDSEGLELDYLDDVLQGTPYQYFETGSSNYGGDDGDFYITDPRVEEMLDKGEYESLDLGKSVKELLQTVSGLGMESVGNPSIVGGLHIW